MTTENQLRTRPGEEHLVECPRCHCWTADPRWCDECECRISEPLPSDTDDLPSD